MAENILVLTPNFFRDIPNDCKSLLSLLQEIEFLGSPLEVNGEIHYRPGEEFMSLITFLGCSPMIATGEMESEGEQYCHIAIEGPLESPRYMVGDNIKVPRCPKCSHRLDNWQTLLDLWQEDPQGAAFCPDCGDSFPLTKLRWRKCAGFGRFFIKVWGVFESEAVPSPNFLAALKRFTGLEWHHFYLRNN